MSAFRDKVRLSCLIWPFGLGQQHDQLAPMEKESCGSVSLKAEWLGLWSDGGKLPPRKAGHLGVRRPQRGERHWGLSAKGVCEF